jgi:Fe-S oxidoreductase/nitrate reductase gamma subunit
MNIFSFLNFFITTPSTLIANAIPHREILWNIDSLANQIVMYLTLVLACIVGLMGVWGRVSFWLSGVNLLTPLPALHIRLASLTKNAAFQKKVVSKPLAGTIHTLMYLGFLVLFYTTTMVFIDHDLGIKIYQGSYYLLLTVASDLFGLGLIIGLALAWQRRKISSKSDLHTQSVDSWALIILFFLCLQGFILEGIRIAVTDDPWFFYSPVGWGVSYLFHNLSSEKAKGLHFFVWWVHTLNVFLLIAIFPYTKFFHLISSSVNLFFIRSEPKGAILSAPDIAKFLESPEADNFKLGVGSIKDYNWKQRLDLDACTSCGRCQEACPSFNAGTPLSPKWIILDARNHSLALQSSGQLETLHKDLRPAVLKKLDGFLLQHLFLEKNGFVNEGNLYRETNPEKRSSNHKVKLANDTLGGDSERLICGDINQTEALWSCTTCMACVEACPVGINPLEHIIEQRRYLTTMQGELPREAQNTLRSLESTANPYGGSESRETWFNDLDVPLLRDGDTIDYLYWVGCITAFDKRKQDIAKALCKILKTAGLSFAVLGNLEGCTGDPARRLGEENLFQTLVKNNLKTLSKVTFNKIVTHCPHCLNTLKNEYSDFDYDNILTNTPIVHHSELIEELIRNDRIKLNENDLVVTFHDPCYLGRGNGIYEAPRSSLKAIKGLKIVEMVESKEKGKCCGAGGGHFWMDLKNGRRINESRVEQINKTKAGTVATACPFCLHMLEDGVKNLNLESEISVKDIAEITVANLQS